MLSTIGMVQMEGLHQVGRQTKFDLASCAFVLISLQKRDKMPSQIRLNKRLPSKLVVAEQEAKASSISCIC